MIENLTKSFADRDIYKDFNMEVKKGEIYGLIGPNGIGKTTLMKIILAWDKDYQGKIFLGKDIKIGYSPENPNFPEILNGREVLDYYMEVRRIGKKERESLSSALMDEVGLDPRDKTKVSKYSKGMKQRLGLAQALIGDPDILLLDEPSAGLDYFGQKMIQNLILKFKSQGKVIFLNSHLLADVSEIVDRGILIMGSEKTKKFDKEDLNKTNLGQIFMDFEKEVGYEGLYQVKIKRKHKQKLFFLFRNNRCLNFTICDRKFRNIIYYYGFKQPIPTIWLPMDHTLFNSFLCIPCPLHGKL